MCVGGFCLVVVVEGFGVDGECGVRDGSGVDVVVYFGNQIRMGDYEVKVQICKVLEFVEIFEDDVIVVQG